MKTDISFLNKVKFGSDYKERLMTLRNVVKITRKYASVKSQQDVAEMLGMTKFRYSALLCKLRKGAKKGFTLEEVAKKWSELWYHNGIVAMRPIKSNREVVLELTKKAKKLHAKGMGYEEIALEIGRSKERARQMVLGLNRRKRG